MLYTFRNTIFDNYKALKTQFPEQVDGTRKDRSHSFKVGFSKNIKKDFDINLGFNYIIQTSNHKLINYNKWILSLGVSYQF